MSPTNMLFTLAVVLFLASGAMVSVASIKSLRAQGAGAKKWAPPALPWLRAGIASLVVSVGVLAIWLVAAA
jgi:hypothetical protein